MGEQGRMLGKWSRRVDCCVEADGPVLVAGAVAVAIAGALASIWIRAEGRRELGGEGRRAQQGEHSGTAAGWVDGALSWGMHRLNRMVFVLSGFGDHQANHPKHTQHAIPQ